MPGTSCIGFLLVAPCLAVGVVISSGNGDHSQEARKATEGVGDGPWYLSLDGKCIKASAEPPRVDLGSYPCTKFYGFDARGSRVLFRLYDQSNEMVLHYDAERQKWTIKKEDSSHFERKQLFEMAAGGMWCLAYDRSLCLKIGVARPPTTTSTTTTTTTVSLAPPKWIKGQEGQNCYAACGEGNRCLEDKWFDTEDQFREVLKWVGETTCTSVVEGDWESFPGQFDGDTCYYSTRSTSDKDRCRYKHFSVARFCACQGPDWTTTASPSQATTTTVKSLSPELRRRRRAPKRRRRAPKPTTTATAVPTAKPTAMPTTAPPVAKCPEPCAVPACKSGVASNGGVNVVDGKCHKYCSMPYGGTRYCGEGPDYQKGPSVNCQACAIKPPPKPVSRRRRRGKQPAGPGRRRGGSRRRSKRRRR